MTSFDSVHKPTVAFYTVITLLLLAGGILMVEWQRDRANIVTAPTEAVAPTPAAPAPVAVEPTPTPTPTPTPSATPTPTLAPTETVLFRGGPATGPWQQLGTVAEITHPNAPPTARYSYTEFWSDPEEENQSDDLWDQIVREVTLQLIDLGEPVDEVVFGGAPGSEPFNSFGGINNIYFGDRVFTASWSGIFEDHIGVARAYFHYLFDFDGSVIDRRAPVVFRDDGVRTFEDNASESVASLREWAAERGYVACDGC